MTESKKYAIVASGGKHFRVTEGQKVVVDRLCGKAGDAVKLDKVLLTQDGSKLNVGAPYVQGASIGAKILGHTLDKKLIIFKKRRRKGYTKKQGHRQERTTILVESING
jgi:large subunit ribosomal protein L21